MHACIHICSRFTHAPDLILCACARSHPLTNPVRTTVKVDTTRALFSGHTADLINISMRDLKGRGGSSTDQRKGRAQGLLDAARLSGSGSGRRPTLTSQPSLPESTASSFSLPVRPHTSFFMARVAGEGAREGCGAPAALPPSRLSAAPPKPMPAPAESAGERSSVPADLPRTHNYNALLLPTSWRGNPRQFLQRSPSPPPERPRPMTGHEYPVANTTYGSPLGAGHLGVRPKRFEVPATPAVLEDKQE